MIRQPEGINNTKVKTTSGINTTSTTMYYIKELVKIIKEIKIVNYMFNFHPPGMQVTNCHSNLEPKENVSNFTNKTKNVKKITKTVKNTHKKKKKKKKQKYKNFKKYKKNTKIKKPKIKINLSSSIENFICNTNKKREKIEKRKSKHKMYSSPNMVIFCN